jgi:hydroxymethylpyrimidine/phosphomethylpyrimidine kinase
MLPIALSIAGSDSGGGAGIQADLKAFQAFGVFGTTAITALTAQNTRGVSAVHAIPAAMVLEQIRAVVDDLRPAACKTGMLATAELAETVASAIEEGSLRNYVLDPVMVATTGARLLDASAEGAIIELLLPLCKLVTPNLDEAAVMAGRPVRDEVAMREVAREFVERGAGAALIKGGHLEGEEVVDILYDGDEFWSWRRAKLATPHTHGTGCTLAAAITAGLAHGRNLTRAVEEGLDYVHRAIREAPGLGSGNGPLNHFVSAAVPVAAGRSR